MKKETLKLTIRIILIGIVALCSSYIPDLYPNFFGDWYCEGSGELTNNHFAKCDYNNDYHNPEWHWGYRHYIYFIMCIVLLIVQINDIAEQKQY